MEDSVLVTFTSADRGGGSAAIPNSPTTIPCWGNMLPTVRQLYAARQFAPLALVSIEFIKSMSSGLVGNGRRKDVGPMPEDGE